MRRLLVSLAAFLIVVGTSPESIVRLHPQTDEAEARAGGRGGGFRGGGGFRSGGGGFRGGSVSRPSTGARPSRPDYRPVRPSTRPSPGDGFDRPVAGVPDQPGRPSQLPVETRPGLHPPGGLLPDDRPPIGTRPSHPIELPPGTRPPGWRPPGSRPPDWRPPHYPPPYPRPPHWHWGDYYWYPSWGWYLTGAVAGSTLIFVETLPLPAGCEEVIYEGETLYLCDGILYRATYYDDELVYEIVSPPGGDGAPAGDVEMLQLTSPRMRGEAVRAVQQALIGLGYDPGTADGIFGPATDRALRDFQRGAGLQVHGMVDEDTARALGI